MTLLRSLVEPLQYTFMQQALVGAILVGVTCAVMGSFLLVKRWALLGDAISHAVLPGVAVAFLLGVPFVVGALVTGLLTALGIGFVERHTRLKQDAAMGLLFVSAFALGLAIISRIRSPVDLFHVLFGNVLAVSRGDLLLTGSAGLVVVLTIVVLFKELLLWAFDPTMAESVGLPVRALHYLMLLLTSLTIVASLQAVGIVLVIAMLIAPPATALLLTDRFHRLIVLAAGIGVGAAVVGLFLSYYLDVASGAAMALVGTLAFGLALGFSPRRGLVARALRRRRASVEARVDDYLKALFAQPAGHATLPEVLGNRLSEPAPTVRATVRRLVDLGLAEVTPHGVRLTARGRRQAAEVVRAHRLWERFLVDRAGLPWEEVHAAADRMEHGSTPDVTQELARAVGGLAVDPHGAPIPTEEGAVAGPEEEYLLSELQPGQGAVVTRVEDEDPETLRALSALGLVPGRAIRLLAATREGLTVAVDGVETAVARRIARSVFVTPTGESRPT
ncbi:MAG: metal ABC transporter permease [Armatimonadota bacterium]|nr:metal ABC transporter permease [Armatimonadota bacterium]